MLVSERRLQIERALRRLGLRSRRRVFGIGLPRTGTVSLTSALNELGFRILHYPHDPRTFDELTRGICRLSVLDDFDGITDLPAVVLYRELARAYPRSKFVLTLRDAAGWLRSLRGHWQRFPSRTAGEEPDHLHAFRRWTRQAGLGVTEFDADVLLERSAEHHAQVQDFFRNEPGRLLVMDLCGGEGWERLCPFLGKRVPRSAFPWHHRAHESLPPV